MRVAVSEPNSWVGICTCGRVHRALSKPVRYDADTGYALWDLDMNRGPETRWQCDQNGECRRMTDSEEAAWVVGGAAAVGCSHGTT